MQQAEQRTTVAAAELPHGVWPLLYSHVGAIDIDSFDINQPVKHYILSICIRDNHNHKFPFPLLVFPHAVAHVPWRKDILEEPLGKYQPRFSSTHSTVLVKHALLVLVADLFIRPLDLPLGTVRIDSENDNLLVYDIVIPDSFDTSFAQSFVQTFLYPPMAKASRTGGSVKKLERLYPACPITLFTNRQQCSHLLDHRTGPSLFQLINQGLHDEATRTARYGDLLKPWEGLVWTGADIDGQLNKVHTMVLNQFRDRWAFLAVLENPHQDDAFCNDMLHFVELWEGQRERTLPAYVFLNFDLATEVPFTWCVGTRRTGADRTLSGMSTVWFEPGVDHDRTLAGPGPCPRPADWFPTHPSFPPPYSFNNTLAARIVGSYRSYAVDAFALCARSRDVLPRRNHDDVAAGSLSDSSDFGCPGTNTDSDDQQSSSKLDRPDDPFGMLTLALLSLAAVYADCDGRQPPEV